MVGIGAGPVTSAVPLLCKCGHDSDLHVLDTIRFGTATKDGWGVEPRSPGVLEGSLTLFWRFDCAGRYNASSPFPRPCTCINFRLDTAIHKTFKPRGPEEDN